VAEFSLVSDDGDEGYPGRLLVRARYTLAADEAVLKMDFEARLEEGSEVATIVNLANHAYWNLSGDLKETAASHDLQVACTHMLERSPTTVPTGEYVAVDGTPFDFTRLAALAPRFEEVKSVDPGFFDLCYSRGDRAEMEAWRAPAEPTEIALLRHPGSGRSMRVLTTQPGVQLYTGHFLPPPDAIKSRSPPYSRHVQNGAICLETQHFPDAINHPHFPSVVLRPGELYKHTTSHIFAWQ
jgi:aldose 1-epimerase